MSSKQLTIQGETFQIKPLTMKDLAAGVLGDGTPYSHTIFIPEDESNLGKYQIYNLDEEPLRKTLFSLMETHLYRDGEPLTYDNIVKLNWNVNDVGAFLYKLIVSPEWQQ